MRTVTGETLKRKFHAIFTKMGFDTTEATEQAGMALEYAREHGAVTLMDGDKAVTFTKVDQTDTDNNWFDNHGGTW